MGRFRDSFRRIDPFMLVLVGIMIAENITRSSGNLGTWFYTKLMILPGIIIGLTFHEAAHAYASYRLGDPTPKTDGRLSLNPKDHIDILGFVFLLIAGFGWGQPVRIDPRYYKHRRRDEFIVSIAGVATNFLVAVVFCFIVRLIAHAGMNTMVLQIFAEICVNVVGINIVLMLFNLIPCPPLDGWGIITQIFDLQKYDWWYQVYSKGSFILMLLIVFNVTQIIISPLYQGIVSFLFNIIVYS